jgi:hypothetical protein
MKQRSSWFKCTINSLTDMEIGAKAVVECLHERPAEEVAVCDGLAKIGRSLANELIHVACEAKLAYVNKYKKLYFKQGYLLPSDTPIVIVSITDNHIFTQWLYGEDGTTKPKGDMVLLSTLADQILNDDNLRYAREIIFKLKLIGTDIELCELDLPWLQGKQTS